MVNDSQGAEIAETSKPLRTVCPGCSLLCDDILAIRHAAGPIEIHGACSVGQQWYQRRSDNLPAQHYLAGHPVGLEEALQAAARYIHAASMPLICGIQDWPLEAQQQAVTCIRKTGGYIALQDSPGPRPPKFSAPSDFGQVTATLGIVNRSAEIVLFWYTDPSRTHPRLIERHCQTARRLIAIQDPASPCLSSSDPRLEVWHLDRNQARQALALVDGSLNTPPTAIEETAFLAEPRWQELGNMLRHKLSAWFIGPPTNGSVCSSEMTSERFELHRLIVKLNQYSRAFSLELTEHSNQTGAHNVLTWSSGQAGVLHIERGGAAAFECQSSVAQLLSDNVCDVILAGDGISRDTLLKPTDNRAVRRILLFSSFDTAVLQADVAIAVSQVGWDGSGEYCRLDHLTLYLPELASTTRPSPYSVLSHLYNDG
ncbi:MAG TPA: hypothetical protein PKD54_04385 [Pirellulaceae bacterium]|nr:hypothetical protein [Pirellulaceae bacterium]